MLQDNCIYQLSGKDLQDFARTLIASTKEELERAIIEDKAERYLTPDEVAKMLSINLTTLWRWRKRKFLLPVKVGAKSRYLYSEVKAMLTTKTSR